MKPCALDAFRRCTEGCFFITSSLRPVIVEMFDDTEDDDGLKDKMLPKRSPEFHKEREVGPRFAEMSTFEFEYGEKWKQLYEMRKQKVEALDREMKLEEDKLMAQMEYARYEHETESLRQQLQKREQERELNKKMWEQKDMEMSRMFDMEQQRRQEEEKMMMERMQRQDESMKRRQEENNMFMQGQDNMGGGPMGGGGGVGGGMGGRGGSGSGMGGGRGGLGGGPLGGGGGFSDQSDEDFQRGAGGQPARGGMGGSMDMAGQRQQVLVGGRGGGMRGGMGGVAGGMG